LIEEIGAGLEIYLTLQLTQKMPFSRSNIVESISFKNLTLHTLFCTRRKLEFGIWNQRELPFASRTTKETHNFSNFWLCQDSTERLLERNIKIGSCLRGLQFVAGTNFFLSHRRVVAAGNMIVTREYTKYTAGFTISFVAVVVVIVVGIVVGMEPLIKLASISADS
jgi:hypothetical protein